MIRYLFVEATLLFRASHRSQDRFDPFAPDHIQQDQRRPFRALGAALKIGDVADRQLEMMREDGLAETDLFADGPDLIARQLGWVSLRALPMWRMVILSQAASGSRPVACISLAISND